MLVRHSQGKVVDVSEAKATQLTATGSWIYVNKADRKPVEAVKDVPEGGDTEDAPKLPEKGSQPQEEVKPVATIQEMREWGIQNEIPGANPKGKLARSVVEAYQDAHKE